MHALKESLLELAWTAPWFRPIRVEIAPCTEMRLTVARSSVAKSPCPNRRVHSCAKLTVMSRKRKHREFFISCVRLDAFRRRSFDALLATFGLSKDARRLVRHIMSG